MRSWAFLVRILVGVVAAWVLGWGFVEIGEGISGGIVPAVDRRVLDLVTRHREADVTRFMLLLTYLGSASVCIPISIIVASWLWIRRRRLAAAMTALVLLGSSLVSLALKYAYNRPRPDIAPLVKGVFSSFPSGHTVTGTAFYGFLTYIAVRNARWYWKVVGAAVYVALVLGIGFSRIYLGIHWPTDVIGGILAGTAWLVACISAYEVVMHVGHRRRRLQREKDSGASHV